MTRNIIIIISIIFYNPHTSHTSHTTALQLVSYQRTSLLLLARADLPDIIKHRLLLLLLPLLLQHLGGHHGLHLVRVVVLSLGGVAEHQTPGHHEAAHGHEDDPDYGTEVESHSLYSVVLRVPM